MKRGGCGYVCTVGWGGGWGREGERERELDGERVDALPREDVLLSFHAYNYAYIRPSNTCKICYTQLVQKCDTYIILVIDD